MLGWGAVLGAVLGTVFPRGGGVSFIKLYGSIITVVISKLTCFKTNFFLEFLKASFLIIVAIIDSYSFKT